jgi:hypothetical protein
MLVKGFRAGTVGVVPPQHDPQFPTVGDEIGVPQPQRLPDPHAGFGQQEQQEAVPHVLARLDQGQQLLLRQRPRQLARLPYPHWPG